MILLKSKKVAKITKLSLKFNRIHIFYVFRNSNWGHGRNDHPVDVDVVLPGFKRFAFRLALVLQYVNVFIFIIVLLLVLLILPAILYN